MKRSRNLLIFGLLNILIYAGLKCLQNNWDTQKYLQPVKSFMNNEVLQSLECTFYHIQRLIHVFLQNQIHSSCKQSS